MSDDPPRPELMDPETSDEDWDVIEDADESQEAHVMGEVPGIKDTEGLEVDNLRHQAEMTGAAILHYTVTGLLVVAALAVGIWAFLEPPALGQPSTDTAASSTLDRARLHSARTRLEWALETYRIEAKDYPDDLSTLADRGLLRSRDVYYPLEGSRWRYETTTDGYRLEAEKTTDE